MSKEYIFTYSVVVEAEDNKQAIDEFTELWENSKDYIDWDAGETEVSLFNMEEVK